MKEQYLLEPSKKFMFAFINLILFFSNTRNKFMTEWNEFSEELQTKNRFTVSHPLVERIIKNLSLKPYILQSGSCFYRARTNCTDVLLSQIGDYRSIGDFFSSISISKINEIKSILEQAHNTHFWGFDAKNSGAPPSDKATGSRANPEGISYLYGAEDVDTALMEVRPLLNDKISIATFKANKDLRLANLADFLLHEGSGWENADVVTIFSQLYTGDTKSYLPTQYLAEKIKHSGFDGIRFRSSLNKSGINLTLFTPEDCSAVASDLYHVTNINYEKEKLYPLTEEGYEQVMKIPSEQYFSSCEKIKQYLSEMDKTKESLPTIIPELKSMIMTALKSVDVANSDVNHNDERPS